MSVDDDVEINAARAEQLSQDELLQNILATMMHDALNVVDNTDLGNQPECVAAVARIQAAHDFMNRLRGIVTAGKAAKRKPHVVA
jgi:hypothetical protein